MTEESDSPPPPPPTEVLAETIDLSSESSSSSSSEAGWQPLLPAVDPPGLVKYTYFGYETYARPPTAAMPTAMPAKHRGKKDSASTIKGNGTGKVTINVSYRPDSRASSTSSIPRGVRSFHKNGHVRNWSSLSHTSASSSSSYHNHHRGSKTLPPRAPQQKVIRWSSEDRLPRRQSGFFWSLKRISIQSLTKAKHKTGKLFSSMKTKLMGSKRSSADGSEDSAYDTSEVCLSPSGRQTTSSHPPAPPQGAPSSKGARRQQSWSFHDLREVERPVRRRKHRRHSRRKVGRSSSSSDSGVEARSDHSGRKSTSDPGRLNAAPARVEVKHGLTRKWSHTNIQDELGYIP